MESEDLAKLLIGRPGRLRLAGWVLREVAVGAYFYQDEARKGTGDVINEVRQNLRHFETLGLIKTAYRDPGPGRRLYYQRLASPVWAVYKATLTVIATIEKERRTGRQQRRRVPPAS